MHVPFRVFGAFLVSLIFTSNGDCSSLPLSKDVMELRSIIIGLGDDSNVNGITDLFASLQMRDIGADDAIWKRDNPNWTPVLKMIGNDFRHDLGPYVAALKNEAAHRMEQALAAHLSTGQIDELLRFYRSETGLRYREFQTRVMRAENEGSVALVTAVTSGGMDPQERPMSTPSAAQFQARKKVLALSWASQVTPSLGALASPSRGARAKDDKAIHDMMADMLVKTRGRELDDLQQQFGANFDAF